MRDFGLACDEGRPRRRALGENRMSEGIQIKPETNDVAQSAVSDSSAVSAPAMTPEQLEAFGNELIAALKTVYDPEIPVDLYELGLIYKVDVADNKDVTIDMTLTAPECRVAGEKPHFGDGGNQAGE